MKKLQLWKIGVLILVVVGIAAVLFFVPLKRNPGDKKELLTFITPASGQVIVVQDLTDPIVPQRISWTLADPQLRTLYTDKQHTYLYFQLIDAQGNVVGAAATSPNIIDTTSVTWNIVGELRDDFYVLHPGAKYKLRATLVYGPKYYSCNPAVPKEQGCDPVYSDAERILIDKAKSYQSESGWFTFDLTHYVHPEAVIDANSLNITSAHPVITGTANVKIVTVYISNDSNEYMPPGTRSTQTDVPVVNGRWSYEPSLQPGSYSVSISFQLQGASSGSIVVP